MNDLPPALRSIRDFYFKEALVAPPAVTHVHRRGLATGQRLFALADLRRHLDNPFLDPDYVTLFVRGQPVDLSQARMYKVVQRRKLAFCDRRAIEQHLAEGAACVLEGLDILEPSINAFAAILDRANATFCNATAFYSQLGNEAYRGHVDTDDVLVLHIEGRKRWRLHARQAARRVELSDLDEQRMGPVEAQIVMQPGDVMYLRSFTPHSVETLTPHSLHVSFDLCDRQPSIEQVLTLLLRHYDRSAVLPQSTSRETLGHLAELSRSPSFEKDLAELMAAERKGHGLFRQLLAQNRIRHFDALAQAAAQAESTAGS